MGEGLHHGFRGVGRAVAACVRGCRGWVGAFVALGGTLLGAAVQLRQPLLWAAGVYVALLLVGLGGGWLLWRWRGPRLLVLMLSLACGAMAGAGLAGWRATAYAQGALEPQLEGRDLRLTGVVSQMPQPGEIGTRFRFDVETAQWAEASRDAAPPAVPPRIALAWYGDYGGCGSSPPNVARPSRAPWARCMPASAGN